MKKNEKRGKLYVVSTHIGNKEDITLRAIEILKLVDLVICEELKVGSILLKDLRINNRLDTLNEQNEDQKVFEYLQMIQEDDKKLALISDCGTPVFADPGYSLVQNALLTGVNVIVVPGVTSLMTALVRSGMSLDQFLYAGFLSRKREERIDELIELSKESRTVVVYDTPYRLLPILEDASKIMPHRKVYLGMNLTMPFETHHYGTFNELYAKFKDERIKAEFVICFEGASNPELSKKFAKRREDILEDEKSTSWKKPRFEPRFERRNFDNKKDNFDSKRDNKDKRSKSEFAHKKDNNNKRDYNKKDYKSKPKFR